MALVSYRSQNIEDLFGVGRWVKGGGRVESRTRFKRKVLRVNGAEVMPRSQQQQPPSSPSPFLPPVFLTLSSFSPFGSPTLLPLAFPTEARKKEARRYAGVSSPLPRSYTFSSLSLSLSLSLPFPFHREQSLTTRIECSFSPNLYSFSSLFRLHICIRVSIRRHLLSAFS